MSFSDLMESGRGPGVIGTLLALVVLAIFVLLYLFAFDEGMQGAGKSIESIISHQEEEIRIINGAISRGREKLGEIPVGQANARDLAGIKRENRYRESQIGGLKEGIAKANEAITSKTAEFEAYKDQYRALVRGQAKGEAMERLETRNGTVYTNVTIREVTAIGIHIRHDAGLKRIPFEEIPAALQDHFQFDPNQKAAAVADEELTRGAHETAVSDASAAASQHAAQQKKSDAEALREKTIRAIAVKESRLLALKNEIYALQNAIRNEGTKPLSRAPKMRAELIEIQNEFAALQADVARLRASQ